MSLLLAGEIQSPSGAQVIAWQNCKLIRGIILNIHPPPRKWSWAEACRRRQSAEKRLGVYLCTLHPMPYALQGVASGCP